MVETPVTSTICMTQNTPFFKPCSGQLSKKVCWILPSPNCQFYKLSCGLLILFHIQILPSLPFHVDGGKAFSHSPLLPQIPHYLHALLFPNPLLPWTADVLLLQDNSWGGGKEIKIVLGKAEFNQPIPSQKTPVFNVLKLYSQSPLQTQKPPKSSFK